LGVTLLLMRNYIGGVTSAGSAVRVKGGWKVPVFVGWGRQDSGTSTLLFVGSLQGRLQQLDCAKSELSTSDAGIALPLCLPYKPPLESYSQEILISPCGGIFPLFLQQTPES
jgi:hypothetical protein